MRGDRRGPGGASAPRTAPAAAARVTGPSVTDLECHRPECHRPECHRPRVSQTPNVTGPECHITRVSQTPSATDPECHRPRLSPTASVTGPRASLVPSVTGDCHRPRVSPTASVTGPECHRPRGCHLPAPASLSVSLLLAFCSPPCPPPAASRPSRGVFRAVTCSESCLFAQAARSLSCHSVFPRFQSIPRRQLRRSRLLPAAERPDAP